MSERIDLERVYAPSDDVVVREIEGEIVIVPLASGIADVEDELFTLNETGREIWSRIDGSRPLADVVEDLASRYEAPVGRIRHDVLGICQELLARQMIVAKG